MIAFNWAGFIWGVNNGHVVEVSLGYFINPLVTVLMGVVILRERLRPLQWAALGVASTAVVVLTVDYGRPPWVALLLACSFGTYGLAKKQANAGAVESLAFETALLAPLARGVPRLAGLARRVELRRARDRARTPADDHRPGDRAAADLLRRGRDPVAAGDHRAAAVPRAGAPVLHRPVHLPRGDDDRALDRVLAGVVRAGDLHVRVDPRPTPAAAPARRRGQRGLSAPAPPPVLSSRVRTGAPLPGRGGPIVEMTLLGDAGGQPRGGGVLRGRLVAAAEPLQQVGAYGVEPVVVPQPPVGQQRLDHGQRLRRAAHLGDRDRVVERHHGTGRLLVQHPVEQLDLRPVASSAASGASAWTAAIAACSW